MLSGSRFPMDEEIVFQDLERDVEVVFDDYGVPTIKGNSRLDVARSLGYLHAQERLYSMEMQRRLAAGELAEIVGRGFVGIDRNHRRYDFRNRARMDFDSLMESEKRLLIAYCEGVNFGIERLNVRPWELLLLGCKIEPWKPEDSLLVGYSMYISLQGDMDRKEKCRFVMKTLLPEDVYSFFVENGSVWDSALDGSRLPLIPIPDKNSFSYINTQSAEKLGEVGHRTGFSFPHIPEGTVPGSNAWAISGAYTRSGSAMLANDMHLPLRVPNIWYRANFEYEGSAGTVSVFGATLPGLPIMIIGSNGSIAWGFTNSRVDTVDLVEIEIDSNDESQYLVPGGSEAFRLREETIKIKGGDVERVTYRQTRWGPVDSKIMGRTMALRWRALEGTGINLALREFESCESVEEALTLAPKIEMPTLNLILADRSGNIAWTLAGPIMVRKNYRGDVPVNTAQLDPMWESLDGSRYPKIVNPTSGYLWNANNRALGDELYMEICHRDTVIPARSYQINSRLSKMSYPINEHHLLDVQMDVEGIFYTRWKRLLVDTIRSIDNSEDPRIAKMLEVVEAWNGEARSDSTGFLLVRDFRETVSRRVLRRLLGVCYDEYRRFNRRFFRFEEPLWMIVSQKPNYLRSPDSEGWDSELAGYVYKQLENYEARYGSNFEINDLMWGDINTLSISHPMSSFIPLIGKWVDMEDVPVSGDLYVTNVVGNGYGSSERMVVSPGSEESGIFHMPGGQSGHPLSEYYRKGHREWLRGDPVPLKSDVVSHRIGMYSRSDD